MEPFISPNQLQSLKIKLKKLNVSQKEISEFTGMSKPHISKVLNGHRRLTLPFTKLVSFLLDTKAKELLNHLNGEP